jgi:hypothetical protein
MSGKASTPASAPVAVQSAPPADDTLDADIAAFIAEGHEPDDEEPPEEDGEEPEAEEDEDEDDDAEDDESDDDADDGDSDGDDEVADEDSAEDDAEDEEQEPAPSLATAVDLKALKKALDADDPVAFVKALGAKAETLLTGKAHKALRLQVKELERTEAKANLLATQLGEKYGDPIAARKAAESGDVDAFITMVEKWAGHPWNDVARWVTAGIAGRPARLEQKQREEQSAALTAKAKQEQAVAEMTAWVDSGVKKLAPELHSEEVTALVVAEIRAGFNQGVTTPAKALPLVKAKLEAQYRRLHKVFGARPPKKKTPAPSARIQRPQTGGSTRETSLDEDIADFMKEHGLKSSVPKKKKRKAQR